MHKDELTSAEAAEALGIDRSNLNKLVHAGRIDPARKLPGRTGAYLFDRSDVERLADERAARSIAASLATSREAGIR